LYTLLESSRLPQIQSLLQDIVHGSFRSWGRLWSVKNL
jgi:hypothetical protein